MGVSNCAQRSTYRQRAVDHPAHRLPHEPVWTSRRLRLARGTRAYRFLAGGRRERDYADLGRASCIGHASDQQRNQHSRDEATFHSMLNSGSDMSRQKSGVCCSRARRLQRSSETGWALSLSRSRTTTASRTAGPGPSAWWSSSHRQPRGLGVAHVRMRVRLRPLGGCRRARVQNPCPPKSFSSNLPRPLRHQNLARCARPR